MQNTIPFRNKSKLYFVFARVFFLLFAEKTRFAATICGVLPIGFVVLRYCVVDIDFAFFTTEYCD